MNKHTLDIKNIYAAIEGKDILNGISLTVRSGEVHAVMGPNGSGKSTLAYVLMGHPNYVCEKKPKIKSHITIDDQELIDLKPEERAKQGLFLAFQSPIAVPGVSVMNLLRTSYQAQYTKPATDTVQNPVLARRWQAGGMTLSEFIKQVKIFAKLLHMPELFFERSINDGFSGGEKKKIEMLQALVLAPKFAIFDEIDTGLDVDALQVVAAGMKQLQENGTGVIVITHYQRILKYLQPNFVHIFVKGNIVHSGDAMLAKEIEDSGYQQYISAE